MYETYRLVPVHAREDLKNQAASLLEQVFENMDIRQADAKIELSNDQFPQSLCFLDDEGSVVGHLCLDVDDEVPDALKVESVGVLPHRQGDGIGEKMMEQAENWAKRKGFNTFHLKAKTTRAIRFYLEKCGFSGVIPDRIQTDKIYKLKKTFKFELTDFEYLQNTVFF